MDAEPVLNDPRLKVTIVCALVAAAIIGRAHGALIVGLLLAFGLFNAVFSPPGTAIVRIISSAWALFALLAPGNWWTLVAVLGWLAWPPMYAVAWSLGRRGGNPLDVRAGDDAAWPDAARLGVSAIILSVALASAAYRAFVAHNLHQTSALFVGLPALIAIVVVLIVAPRTAIGVAIKAVTVGLLVSMVFLGEGILCVLMSAPLFYFAAIAIAAVMQRTSDGHLNTPRVCAALLVLVPMTLEGITPATTFNRDETVTASKIVHATPDAIACALSATPRFDRALPFYLRAGFPRAAATRIDRRGAAARWVIAMRGGERRLDGMEPRTGDLVLELVESRPGLVRWRAIADASHMTHFLNWQEAIVRWERIGTHESRVTWTLRYRRGLDPAWYFGPMERYASRLAAAYLIDAVAMP
ncbi:MAG TPA: hypothetical protein VKH42_14440 [Vicinamibacterales bacterium]|nr:hypothetical protein [Vicinamibacterales bacterium]